MGKRGGRRRAARRALEGLRARAASCVDGASAALARADPDRGLDPDAVHALRVACKRLRATWQLLRVGLGARCTEPKERALRSAARSLAGARDAHVLERTLARIDRRRARTDACDGPDEHAALACLAALLAAEPCAGSGRAPVPTAILVPVFEAQRRALQDLQREPGIDALADGLLRSYTRARSAGRRAALFRDDEAWHRARRWTKYELYQLELLSLGDSVGARAKELARLGETLGRFQDLCMLSDRAAALARRLAARRALAPVRRVLGRERRALTAELARGFPRLYAAEPDVRRGAILEVLTAS